MVHIYFQMEIDILENGKITREMDLELVKKLMEINMKDIGKVTKNMEKEYL